MPIVLLSTNGQS